jgi:uncharacterized protein YecT (DUF1311 family)
MTTWKIIRTAMALAMMVIAMIALSAISADATEADCTDSKIGEYAECALTKLAILEADLKTVYSRLVANAEAKELGTKLSLPGKNLVEPATTTRARLEKSQTAWAGFREADCLLRGAEMLGSQGHDLLVYQCRLEHTDQRLKYLRSLAI